MQKEFITTNSKQTRALGKMLAEEIIAAKNYKGSTLKGKRLNLKKTFVICLEGDLGAGKTTFTQGLLRGLKVKGPYTSPTFVVMKEYQQKEGNIYHIDAYRVNSEDILNLGWEEIVAGKNIIIVEWADRIKKIIPPDAAWIKFEWLDDKKRRIIIK